MSVNIYQDNTLKPISGGKPQDGHTIIDESNNTYSQREGLKFVGATIADDNNNNRTVITVKQMVGAGSGSAGSSGTVPAPSENDNTKVLYGDGTWKSVPSPVIMIGADNTNAGSAGYVPAPSAGYQNKVLKGDGTWGDVSIDPTSCTTSFSSDGSTITQVYPTKTLTTVFNANGSITETMTDNSTSATLYTKTTVFNNDGSITETVTLV